MNSMSRLLSSLLVAALLAATLASEVMAVTGPNPSATRPGTGQWLSALTSGFTPNVGQVPDAAAKFVLRDRGVTAFFTDHGFVLCNGQSTTLQRDGREVRVPVAPRWQLVGARPVTPVGGEALAQTVGFFRGPEPAQWRTQVPMHGNLRYPEILDGVELRMATRRAGFEYTLHIAPHARPELRFRYDGITGLTRSPDGDLVVHTAIGHLTESRPVAFQWIGGEKRDVASAFEIVSANEYRIVVGAYDARHELVIDPVIDWSTFLGGGQSDVLRDVKAAPDGGLIVLGETLSTDLPDHTAAFSTGPVASEDTFVARLNADGTQLVWLGYLGGSSSDIPGFKGLALDASGNVYVSGRTDSPDFPATTGVIPAGGTDVFVSKIAADGSALLFSTRLGGGSQDWGWAIDVDPSANVLLAGFTFSPDFPVANPIDNTLDGARDIFLAKLDPSGSVLWSTFLGGAGEERPAAIRSAANGDVLVFGDTSSPDFPATPGAFDATLGGLNDAFLVRIQSDGSQILWSTFLGGSANENDLAAQSGAWSVNWGRGDMQLDSAGNIVVGGQTFSPDFPVTVGAFDTLLAGSSDAYVAKIAPTGGLVWATYLGGAGSGADGIREEIAWGIAVNPWDEVFVVGRTDAASFPVTPTAYQSTFRGGAQDGFVTQLSANGSTVLYSSYLGGTGDDVALGALYDAGNLFVAGWSLSGDHPVTAGARQSGCASCPSQADGYLLKFLEAFIAHDDFESGGYTGGTGWAGGWTVSGDASILTSAGPHAGTRHVRLRRGTGLITRSANISVATTTLRLGFWSKVNSFEGTEHAQVRVSANGRTVTNTLTSAQSDNTYHYYEIPLTGLLPATQVQVAFDANMGDTSDNWYLDDIRLVGTSEPVPPIANAGSDQTVIDTDNSGAETVTLNGSASFDPDGGGIVSYVWQVGATVVGTGGSIQPSLARGVHAVTLTVTDDEGSTASDTVQVTVNAPPPPPANPLHIGDLDGSSATSGKTSWRATVVVAVHDGNQAPVPNATVTVQWGGGASGVATLVADANGRCTFASGNISKNSPTATLTITNVVHATLTYSATENQDPDGDSNGTSITVARPL